MLTDAGGIPIVAKTTAANRHDVTELLTLVNEVPAIKGKPGAPRYRFDELYADRAYNSEPDPKRCVRWALNRRFPNATLNMAAGWGCIDGSLSAPSVGFTSSAAYASVTNADSTFTMRFSPLHVS